MSDELDVQTLTLIEEIKKRKAEIAKIERPQWLTNCSFTYQDGDLKSTINLHTVTDVKKLATCAGFLTTKQWEYDEGCAVLGVSETAPEFDWCGYSYEDWMHDIRLRVDKLTLESKQKKLAKLEERLEAIISPQLKAKLELEAIMSELD